MTPENRKQVLDILDLLGVSYRDFELKYKNEPDVCQLLPVSGGRDSKCLATILVALNPETKFVPVFTDTGDEFAETYSELDRIEEYLGFPLQRIKPELDLYELIEKNGNFLPSQRNRYCTVELKLHALDKYIEEHSKKTGFKRYHTPIGLRSDELRLGRVADDERVSVSLPFLELNIDKERVNKILLATSGIPKTYQHRTRSSCASCFFQRRSEMIATLIHYPDEIGRAASVEKISDEELHYYEGLASYQMLDSTFSPLVESNYFLPKPVSLLTEHEFNPKKPITSKDKCTPDLFDTVLLESDEPQTDLVYAAVAFLVHPLMGLFDIHSDGVYSQKLVNISTSLGGLKRSLAFHYEHLLDTAELYVESRETMMEHLRIGIYQLRFNKGVIPAQQKFEDSYVWSPDGMGYQRLRLLTTAVHNSLVKAGLEQNISKLAEQISHCGCPELKLTWQYEHIQRDAKRLKSNDLRDCGDIIWSGQFEPPAEDKLPNVLKKAQIEAKKNGDNEGLIPCVACSI